MVAAACRKNKTKKSEQILEEDPLGHLRRVQEDDTCEAALAEAEENLAAYKAQEEAPKYLFVQMADDCSFDITDRGNLVLKSRHFHGDTVVFSDRPFTYEEEMSTESFFDDFDEMFTEDNGGKPNAAITLVQNDESKDIVVSVFVKAVVKHRDDPDGPTYVYKLEQSDEQAAVTSLSDVMGGSGGGDDGKTTYDHCSIFIDNFSYQSGTCAGMCWHDYQCQTSCKCNPGIGCYAAPSPVPPPGIYSCGSTCQNSQQCASGTAPGTLGGCRYCVNNRCNAQP